MNNKKIIEDAVVENERIGKLLDKEKKENDLLKKELSERETSLLDSEKKIISLEKELTDIQDDQKTERVRWLQNPKKRAQNKIDYYTSLAKRKGIVIEEEDDTEIVSLKNSKDTKEEFISEEKSKTLVYNKQRIIGRWVGNNDDSTFDKIEVSSDDAKKIKLLLDDGYSLKTNKK